ncbi:MAG TPA: hypothetical protein VFZ34_30885, partial [Blastocatellia bacterium]|nr:hypothetical protein [Blastocatellia bacterium]
MPKTSVKSLIGTRSPANRLKRWIALAFVVTLFAGAVYRVDFTAHLAAQAAAQTAAQTEDPNPYDGKATREDCSFLRNPETPKQALARHREQISRATETVSQAVLEGDIQAVAPQDIPRKNFIDNILFDKMAKD